MQNKAKILIVDDDEDILIAGKLLLRRQGFDVVTCAKAEKIPSLMSDNIFQAIMLDMNFGPGESSGEQGLNWLKAILEIDPESVVVMITAHAGMNLAIKAMKLGATDFVTKPWQNEKLIATISSAASLGGMKNEAKQLRSANKILSEVTTNANHPQILGQSQALKTVLSLVKRSAPTDANVLILGENGTGKELIARELHQQSKRSDNIFLSVDLGAVSESLFESELFGHKKGAFTHAIDDRIGKLEAANGGTLFLDELGNLPIHLQAKLLTVLEQRQVTPLGANQSKTFDVRLICATNATRETLADESHFRQDLLFRLNTVEIPLPPLRDRPEDIPLIAEHYLSYYSKKYQKTITQISAKALDAIQSYSWPGNVRALRHAIERAVIMCDSSHLQIEDFQLAQHSAAESSAKPFKNRVPVQSIAEDASHLDFKEEASLNLEQIEKKTITEALRQYRYNISHTAKALGLTRAALYRRMEKHGL